MHNSSRTPHGTVVRVNSRALREGSSTCTLVMAAGAVIAVAVAVIGNNPQAAYYNPYSLGDSVQNAFLA